MNRRQLLKNSLFAGLAVAVGFKAKSAAAQPNPCTEFGPHGEDLSRPFDGEVHILGGRTGDGKSSALLMIAEAHLAADPKNTVWILDTEGYPWGAKFNVIQGQGSKDYLNRLTPISLTTESLKSTTNHLIAKIQAEPNALILMDMVELLMDSHDRLTRTMMANRFAKAFSRHTGHPVIRTVQSHRVEGLLDPSMASPPIFADSISHLGDRYGNGVSGIHIGIVYRTPKVGSAAWNTHSLILGINPPNCLPAFVTFPFNQDA